MIGGKKEGFMMSTGSTLERIYPFFVVKDLTESIRFYTERLGFEIDLLHPADAPFFAIVCRNEVRLLLKVINDETLPVPNHVQHPWARWDAFVLASDPDALFAEYEARGVVFQEPVADTSDGLRAFELRDCDGYVLCFGKPL